MLNIESIKLCAEPKSFLKCIVFFKSMGYSFEGIQQRLFYLLVTRRPSKNFFKCYFIILQATFHISLARSAWPTKSVPSATGGEVMRSFALRNKILNNFPKVIKRRTIG